MHATELRGLLGTSPTYLTTTTPGRIINRFSQVRPPPNIYLHCSDEDYNLQDVFMSDLEIPWNVVNVVMQGVIVGTYFCLILDLTLTQKNRLVGFVVFIVIPVS
jgi:hypothetical protein